MIFAKKHHFKLLRLLQLVAKFSRMQEVFFALYCIIKKIVIFAT